jgi:hypothetical protein
MAMVEYSEFSADHEQLEKWQNASEVGLSVTCPWRPSRRT